MEALEFIARYGVVPRDAVARSTGSVWMATEARERRLARAGLIAVSTPLPEAGPVAVATRAGLGACGRFDLPVARATASRLRHDSVCARVGARLEREGVQLLSGRELRVEEGTWGRWDYSIRVRARLHRPDLVQVGQVTVPIEVELAPTSQRRLEAIVRRWRRAVLAGRFHRVLYCPSPGVLPYVEETVDRADAAHEIEIVPLSVDDLSGQPDARLSSAAPFGRRPVRRTGGAQWCS